MGYTLDGDLCSISRCSLLWCHWLHTLPQACIARTLPACRVPRPSPQHLTCSIVHHHGHRPLHVRGWCSLLCCCLSSVLPCACVVQPQVRGPTSNVCSPSLFPLDYQINIGHDKEDPTYAERRAQLVPTYAERQVSLLSSFAAMLSLLALTTASPLESMSATEDTPFPSPSPPSP